ncbi:MAG: glycosyltransferase family 1 protein [Verrucomicrobiaceae bacterium]|nr:MAG: glycosyltransferase family 1 protein [Verrucomicrobiaceae bacterium]
MFTCFVREALRAYEDLEIVLFCANGQQLDVVSDKLKIATGFPANDRLVKRLAAEHFRIGPAAENLGCDTLLTTGLVPLISRVPTTMQLFTLHHLNAANEIGGLRSIYRRWASHHGMGKADLVITNTRFACSQILSVAPEIAPKLQQSYEGIDHGIFHSRTTAEEKALLEQRFEIQGDYFFWCSNFYPYKQAELMMEAWCDLPAATRERAPMVMVGGGAWGDSRERTLEIARRRGADKQVKMLGWVSDEEVPLLFRHASVFIHPSREETFGRSVLEAMASGVPCVVQNIPVMQEVTAGHALIVDYADREAASSAMRLALENESLRARLIAGGLERSAEFSFERLAVERVEGMRRMLGLAPGKPSRYHPPVFASSLA